MLKLFRKKEAVLESVAKPAPPVLPALQGTAAYMNAWAHLQDELRWLNRLLAARVLRLRRVDFYDHLKNFRDFFIADEEIDALLAAGIFEKDAASDEGEKMAAKLSTEARSLRRAIDRRVDEALANNVELPLMHLTQRFHLDAFERQALLIGLAPQIDSRYEKLYAYLQNDITKKLPSGELILGLLASSLEERARLWRYFTPTATLRYWGLLESPENESGAAAGQNVLRADSRIVQYVLGNQTVDARVMPFLRFLPALAWDNVVVAEALQSRLRKLFSRVIGAPEKQPGIFYFSGLPGVGKKTLARALCGDLGMALAVVDMGAWAQQTENFSEKLRLSLREGRLQAGAVYFDHPEKLESSESEHAVRFATILQEICVSGWPIFFGSAKPLPGAWSDFAAVYHMEIPPPNYAEQKALWALHLQDVDSEPDQQQLNELSARFDLTGGQIARAVRAARQIADVRDPKNPRLQFGDLLASGRAQSQPKLSALARKITPKYQWCDLVLPADQLSQLRELSNQVKQRHVVMEQWGFADRLSLGQGLNALFAGPSGTGKTMAAEVMAGHLGLDLYKIDLSAVVSKYIGETEKNLSRIFTEAERSNVILFFDEADALLGKRSEVREAHDRYANIEIAYLLQKMEEYTGISILATNLRQNLDDAFIRRIRFIVEFPFPDEEYRARIWRGIWPQQTPLAPELDLAFMARQFKLTGGNIRNIALAAAFLASENGRVVGMKHLLQATKREFQKMGKLSALDDFSRLNSE